MYLGIPDIASFVKNSYIYSRRLLQFQVFSRRILFISLILSLSVRRLFIQTLIRLSFLSFVAID